MPATASSASRFASPLLAFLFVCATAQPQMSFWRRPGQPAPTGVLQRAGDTLTGAPAGWTWAV